MTREDQDRFVSLCRPPTEDELSYGPVPEPPAGFADLAALGEPSVADAASPRLVAGTPPGLMGAALGDCVVWV